MPEGRIYVVEVTDVLSAPVVGRGGCHYLSPVQDEQRARMLIRLLLGATAVPAGEGPWRWPIPGGRRYVALHERGRSFCAR